jgi:hypothetical protein
VASTGELSRELQGDISALGVFVASHSSPIVTHRRSPNHARSIWAQRRCYSCNAFSLTGVLIFEEERQSFALLRLIFAVALLRPLATHICSGSVGWATLKRLVWYTRWTSRFRRLTSAASPTPPRPAERHQTAWTSNYTNLMLQATIARATAKQSVTRVFHTELWDNYGSQRDSSYTSMRDSDEVTGRRKNFRD